MNTVCDLVGLRNKQQILNNVSFILSFLITYLSLVTFSKITSTLESFFFPQSSINNLHLFSYFHESCTHLGYQGCPSKSFFYTTKTTGALMHTPTHTTLNKHTYNKNLLNSFMNFYEYCLAKKGHLGHQEVYCTLQGYISRNSHK